MSIGAAHAAVSSPASAIARVGEASWLSFHAFCSTDRDALLRQVVQPVVARLWAEGIADRFFFIRYPEGGDHVRLRLRIGANVETATAADRAFAVLRASCTEFGTRPDAPNPIEVVPAIFELEIDRYGGPRFFPCALSFFTLSSVDALRFLAQRGHEPRARQLIEILERLTRQAIGMARTAAELRSLADYVVQWRPHMAPIVARADQMFESRRAELTGRIREVLATATACVPHAHPAQLGHARCLSAALDGLEGEERWRALGSQMHMSANRLGLSNAEESYLSGILCRCLDALGAELTDLVAAAARDSTSAGAPVADAASVDSAASLDALVTAQMHAFFGLCGDRASDSGEGAS